MNEEENYIPNSPPILGAGPSQFSMRDGDQYRPQDIEEEVKLEEEDGDEQPGGETQIQAQYKNFFSEEGINELQNRLKGKGGI